MTNIKEVIHLYLGCEVEAIEKWRNYTKGNIYKLNTAILNDWEVRQRRSFDIIKLRLRRLDSMELADMKLWIDRCTELGLKPIDISDKELSIAVARFNKKGFGAMDLSGNPELVPHLIAHLLKQGFDLFGLIDSGQAIDKNLKP